jgi:hypothetical protein
MRAGLGYAFRGFADDCRGATQPGGQWHHTWCLLREKGKLAGQSHQNNEVIAERIVGVGFGGGPFSSE